MLHVVHHPDYVAPAPPGSSFPHNKYGLVMDALRRSECDMIVHEPEVMPRHWLEAVHDPAYVADVLTASVRPEVQKRIGFPVTKQVSRRSQLSPGGTWMAAKLALRHGYAANSAGGSHHALADFILFQAGVDAHADDRLGRLALSDAGLVERDRFVAALARDHDLPIASTLGGGYGHDRQGVAERHARSMITLARHRAG